MSEIVAHLTDGSTVENVRQRFKEVNFNIELDYVITTDGQRIDASVIDYLSKNGEKLVPFRDVVNVRHFEL